MPSFTRTMQARSKPRLRLHGDGVWYCWREHRTAMGVYLGRTTGAGPTALAAFEDLASLEREAIDAESAPPRPVRGA